MTSTGFDLAAYRTGQQRDWAVSGQAVHLRAPLVARSVRSPAADRDRHRPIVSQHAADA